MIILWFIWGWKDFSAIRWCRGIAGQIHLRDIHWSVYGLRFLQR